MFRILTAASLVGVFAAPDEAWAKRPEQIKYECGDVVVTGRVQNLEYRPVNIEGDILGHGWITADVRIADILRGPRALPRLQVQYFAHSYFNEQRDFLLVIHLDDDGVYRVKAARLLERNDPAELSYGCEPRDEEP